MLASGLSLLVVLSLVLLAYLGKSRVAGSLAGFPTVTALVTLLSGARMGHDFASSSTYGIQLGLIATSTFVVAYRLSSNQSPTFAALLSGATYATIVAACTLLPIPYWLSVVVVPLNAVALTLLTARDQPIEHVRSAKRSFSQVLTPVLSAAIIVSSSRQLGTHLSGLLTPFPATIFPLLAYAHTRQPSQLPELTSSVARGLVATLVFVVALRARFANQFEGAWWVAMGAAALTLAAVSILNMVWGSDAARTIPRAD